MNDRETRIARLNSPKTAAARRAAWSRIDVRRSQARRRCLCPDFEELLSEMIEELSVKSRFILALRTMCDNHLWALLRDLQ